MKKHLCVQYTLPYEHIVIVGIAAESASDATNQAEQLFNDGEIWQDSENVPLLYDDFEEAGDSGATLMFTIEQELGIDQNWPQAASCVNEIRFRQTSAQLIGVIAGLTKDGELVNDVEFDMTNDHAVGTLHRLISEARHIIEIRP